MIFSRLGVQLLLFNVLLLFVPLGAFLALDVFESRMLELQEESMASQARVMAAALSVTFEPEGIMASLGRQNKARMRILDRTGAVLADSVASPGPVTNPGPGVLDRSYPSLQTGQDASLEDNPLFRFLYDLGSLPFRVGRNLLGAPEEPSALDDSHDLPGNPAFQRALAGGYGAHTLISKGQRSVTLYSAFPVRDKEQGVIGVALVSQSTYRLLQDMYAIRVSTFQIFLVSLGLAVVLSLLASLTISRPLRKLRLQAEGFMDRWGRPRGSFAVLKGPRELVDLSSALETLGKGLTDHVGFIESFAADLAHEARNPLSAILVASELLHGTGGQDAQQRGELLGIINKEGRRLERLIEASRELSRIDMAVARSPREIFDLAVFLQELGRSWILFGKAVEIRIDSTEPCLVEANREFIQQALEKLIDNGLEFSPQGAPVLLTMDAPSPGLVQVDVSDSGPGIEPGLEEAIFTRFWSGRGAEKGSHMGIGLSIARAIIQASGGSLELLPRQAGTPPGACFRIRLETQFSVLK